MNDKITPFPKGDFYNLLPTGDICTCLVNGDIPLNSRFLGHIDEATPLIDQLIKDANAGVKLRVSS